MAVAASEARLELVPLAPAFGAEVRGVDLNAPMSDAAFAAIWAAFLDYELLLFRGQRLDPHQHVAFARRFGPVDVHVMNQYHKDALPELYFLSNLDEQGRPNGRHPDKGTLVWHTPSRRQRSAARPGGPASMPLMTRSRRRRSGAAARCAPSTIWTSLEPGVIPKTR
jgi:taurine dioxygenase